MSSSITSKNTNTTTLRLVLSQYSLINQEKINKMILLLLSLLIQNVQTLSGYILRILKNQ